MSWLPEFEIGLWNAWILMLYFPLHGLLFKIADKLVGTGTGDVMKKMEEPPFKGGERVALVFSLLITLLLLVSSIFMPLKLGTAWFYAGLAIYLIGLLMFLAAIVNIAQHLQVNPLLMGCIAIRDIRWSSAFRSPSSVWVSSQLRGFSSCLQLYSRSSMPT